MRLPRSEQRRLAGAVLINLEEPEETVAAAWAAELERRSREISDGAVEPLNWESARQEILRELQRREGHHPDPTDKHSKLK